MSDLARALMAARADASRAEREVVRLRAEVDALRVRRRAPAGELCPSRVLPWVLWAMFDEDEVYRITSTLTLPSEWWGDLPISRSAAQTIRSAWGDAHSSRWGWARARLMAAGRRDQIRAEVAATGLTGQELTDAVGIRFDDEVEDLIHSEPWPHTREAWSSGKLGQIG